MLKGRRGEPQSFAMLVHFSIRYPEEISIEDLLPGGVAIGPLRD